MDQRRRERSEGGVNRDRLFKARLRAAAWESQRFQVFGRLSAMPFLVIGADGIPYATPEVSLSWFEREIGESDPGRVGRRAALQILESYEQERRVALARVLSRLLELREAGAAECEPDVEAFAVMDRKLYVQKRGVVPDLDTLRFDHRVEFEKLTERAKERVR